MLIRSKIKLLALSGVASLLLAGCGGDESSSALLAKIEKLESQVSVALQQAQRMEDVNSIQNIFSKWWYLHEAAMYEEKLAFIAKTTPGSSFEIGLRGVYEGVDGAKRIFIDVERNFEKSHKEGMQKKYPDLEFPTDHTGMLETTLTGTPVIEIAKDGQTARGIWMSLMAVGKTHREDPKPQALWIWWKTAIDFTKEDGEWKIWHYVANPMFATPYGTDWVENSLTLPPVPKPGVVVGEGGDHDAGPDRAPTKLYDSYRITREPRLLPAPPEPYDTFDESSQYVY